MGTTARTSARRWAAAVLAGTVLAAGLMPAAMANEADGPDRPYDAEVARARASRVPRAAGLEVAAADALPASPQLASVAPADVAKLAAACPAGRVPAAGFRDVVAGSTFARAIDCLAWYGITTGRSPGVYDPGGQVTRAQMARFLHRQLDDVLWLPEHDGRTRFRDVAPGSPAYAEIHVLASADVRQLFGEPMLTGYADGTFRPRATVDRAQMATFIARALRGTATAFGERVERGPLPSRCRFRDAASIPAAHRGNVELLCALGIATGRADGTYAPSAPVSRAQMAGFLMRLQEVFVASGFTVTPDHEVELFVDNAACPARGADGSERKPFCTLTAAVTRAGAPDLADRLPVLVLTGNPDPYQEHVVVPDGLDLVVVGDPASPSSPTLIGTLTIEGWSLVELLDLVVNDAQSRVDRPAIDVADGGLLVLERAIAIGDGPGIRVDGDGLAIVDGGNVMSRLDAAILLEAGDALLFDALVFKSPVGLEVSPWSAVEVVDSEFDRNDVDVVLGSQGNVLEGNTFRSRSRAYVVDTGANGLSTIRRRNDFTRGVTTATFEGHPALVPTG